MISSLFLGLILQFKALYCLASLQSRWRGVLKSEVIGTKLFITDSCVSGVPAISEVLTAVSSVLNERFVLLN